jgi:hypothetical protein
VEIARQNHTQRLSSQFFPALATTSPVAFGREAEGIALGDDVAG